MFDFGTKVFNVLLLCGTLLAKDDGQPPDNGQLQPQSHNCSTWTYFDNATHSCACGAIIGNTVSCSTEGVNSSKVELLIRFKTKSRLK